MAQIFNQVKVATNENIDLSVTFPLGNYTIDGVIVNANDRVLLKSQSARIENGIYAFNSSGLLVRAADFPLGSIQTGSSIVFVQEGENFADTGWIISTNGSIIVGVTEIYFEKFTLNQKTPGSDVTSSIILRKEKGYPLTNDELDNNFKYLAYELTLKLNSSDFNPTQIVNRINTLTSEEADLNAFRLQSSLPDELANGDTIAKRDTLGNLTATLFYGDLVGNADTATNADFATLAGNVTGVVLTQHGGTGSSTISGARTNLDVVYRGGDSLYGKLTLDALEQNDVAALRIVPSANLPTSYQDGDVWSSATAMFYRLSGITKTFASLESPNFTGVTTVPDNDKAANNTRAANTKFVQTHVTDINAALALKAPLASPSLTGIPTAPTAAIVTENTQIATTKYVRDKAYNILNNYDTTATVDSKISGLNSTLSPRITTAQAAADEALRNAGTPIAAIMYFPRATPPLGWLKCNGELVSKLVYVDLFNAIGYSYGGSGDFFRLPDLRGEFLRGWDDGRGVDAGRTFGSWQKSSIGIIDPSFTSIAPGGYVSDNDPPNEAAKSQNVLEAGFDLIDYSLYTRTLMTNAGNSAGARWALNSNGWSSGGHRPRNVALLACIKAFGVQDDFDASSFSEAINEVNSRVRKAGDTMTGPLLLSGAPTLPLHASTKKYVDDKVAAVALIPGPVGPTGPQGAQGPQGPAGTASHMFTYGQTQAVGYTNQVGSFNDGSNYVDIYPPSGKTMSDLVAFIPSIRSIYFAGGVDGNDALRCSYLFYSGFIRVWCQNTEQRYYPTINWLAIWRN